MADAEVKLGANTAELKGKFDDAAKNAELNLRRIKNALEGTAASSKSSATAVGAGLNTMNQGFVQAEKHAQQFQASANATSTAMSSLATTAIRTGEGKFDDAAKNAELNLRRIKNALEGTAASSKSSATAVGAGLNTMNQGFVQAEKHAQQFQASANATSTAMSSLATTAIRTGAAIIGAWVGHQALKSVIDFEDAVEKLERVMGITSADATNMAIALKLAGTTADSFTMTALNIGRVIKTDSDEFRRLGVAIKGTNGELLPMGDIMRNVYTRMQEFKAGTDQNMFTLALTGRAARDFANEMENLDRVQERAAQIAKAYGVEMGPETQGKIKAFKTEVAALGEIFTIAATKIAIELMPAVKDFATWLTDRGPSALTSFINYLELLRVKFEVMSAEIKAFAVNAGTWFDNMVVRANKAALTLSMTIDGQIKDVPAMWEAANKRIAANNKRGADQVVAIWDKAVANIDHILAKSGGAGAASGVKSGSATFTPKPTGGADPSRMAQFEAMLKAERDAYERMKLDQGSFERWSEEQTSAFWEKIKATYVLSTTELQSVEGKWYDAQRTLRQQNFEASIAALYAEMQAIKFNYDERVRLAQQAAHKIATANGAYSKEAIAAEARVTQEMERGAEQRTRIAEVEANQRQVVSEHYVAMAQLEVNQNVALRNISVEQAIAQEEGLQNRLYAIRARALQEQLALERDPVKIAAINAQIETLELSHQAKLTEIHNRAELERKQYAIAAAQAVQDNFANLLTDLVSGTKNWRDAFKDAIKALTGDLNRLASQQIAKQIFGPGTGANSFLSDIFGKIFGKGAATGGKDTGEATASAALTAAKNAEATSSTTATSAIQMMAAAANSAAAALLAVGGGGGGAAGLGSLFGSGKGGSGFGGPDSSFPISDSPYTGPAFGTYALGTPYVPQDSLAYLHKGEAVIPAKYNTGAGPLSVTNQFVLSGPVDTRTQYQIAEAAARGVRMAAMRHGGG